MEHDTDIATSPESAPSATASALGSEGTREFVRYFFASALALAADAGSLYMLTSVVGVPYLYSGAIAFVLGLIVVYTLSVLWVFEHRSSRSLWFEFSVFTIIGFIGLGINEVVLYIGTGILGWHYLYSKVASVVLVFTWNFAARKRMLFAHE